MDVNLVVVTTTTTTKAPRVARVKVARVARVAAAGIIITMVDVVVTVAHVITEAGLGGTTTMVERSVIAIVTTIEEIGRVFRHHQLS
jgi:hypothetical protein